MARIKLPVGTPVRRDSRTRASSHSGCPHRLHGRGRKLRRGHAKRRGCVCSSEITPRGWSAYGGERSQPMATSGKANGRENGTNRRKPLPCGCDQLPRQCHGKEGVDGSSPSEGSAKAPHVGAFLFRSTCSRANMRWVWSRLWTPCADRAAPRGRATRCAHATTPHGRGGLGSRRATPP